MASLTEELYGAQAKPKSLAEELYGAAQKPNPTEGNSGAQNALSGIGSAFTDLGLGAKQRFLETSQALANKFPMLNNIDRSIFGTTASEQLPQVNQAVAEKRALDAPLMQTSGGKVGNFAGKAIPGIAASLLPGGQTFAAAMLTGGAQGALEPTVDGESVLNNTLLGGGAGAAGYGVAKGLGLGAGMLKDKLAQRAASRALTDTSAQAAKEAGYVLPVSQSNPDSVIANTVDILAGGRPKMAQAASLQNQVTTNAKAAKGLGLPSDTQITPDVLKSLRQTAIDTGYAPIRQAGEIIPGKNYFKALDDIASASTGAERSFPGAVKNEIPSMIDNLRVQKFDAGDAVDMIKVLRETADKAYRTGDNAAGKAAKQAASALEDAIDTHLSESGATGALKSFQDARKLIAKTFTVQSALNSETGNVSALALGKRLASGKPLEGDLLDIAKMAQLSPKSVQNMQYATPAASQLESMMSTGGAIASGNPLLLGVPYLRAGLRNASLSPIAQKTIGAPSYSPSILQMLGANPIAQQAIARSAVPLGLLNFGQ